MRTVRTIGVWLILLLFVSGVALPFAPAVRAACPMQLAAQKRMHCAMPEPEPIANVPSCCQKHQVVITPTSELSAGCCCHLRTAPERAEIPAMLPVSIDVVALPTLSVVIPLPQMVTVAVNVPYVTDENAPRGPPRFLFSPRAPPLS